MGLVKYEPRGLALERRGLLARVDGLEYHDRLVCEESIKAPIKRMEAGDCAKQAKKFFGSLHMIIGLSRPLNRDDGNLFFQQVLKYYGYLTWGELRLAFEYLGQGKLDPFLPRNGRGEADRAHYDRFSLEYFMRIVTAYNKMKSKAWDNASRKALPLPEQDNPVRREFFSNEFRLHIVSEFMDYCDHDKAPVFLIPKRVVEVLTDAGLVEDGDTIMKGVDIRQASAEVGADVSIHRSQRVEMLANVAKGVLTNLVGTTAEWNLNNRIIAAVFARAKEDKTDLTTLLCISELTPGTTVE